MRIAVIINARAGTVLRLSPSTVTERLSAIWGSLGLDAAIILAEGKDMGRMVREASQKNKGGCFAILEGGYNHRVLGKNVRAFIEGMESVA